MPLKRRPYHLLLLTGLALVLSSFFTDKAKTIDIHVHDTFFVIEQGMFLSFFSFIVCLLWFLYVLTRNVLYSNTLTWIHVIVSILSVLFLLFIVFFGSATENPQPARYLDFSRYYSFNENNPTMTLITYSLIAFVLTQFIFLVNIVTGLFKRRV